MNAQSLPDPIELLNERLSERIHQNRGAYEYEGFDDAPIRAHGNVIVVKAGSAFLRYRRTGKGQRIG